MRKTRRKWISILLTLAMLVGLMVPLAPAAMAATSYRALNVPSVLDGTDQRLGSVIIEVDGGTLDGKNDIVNLKLPSDFKVGLTAGAAGSGVTSYVYLKDGNKERVKVTLPQSLSGKVNELNPYGNVTVSDVIELKPVSNEEFQLIVKKDPSTLLEDNKPVTTDASIIRIEFPSVYVDSGFSGDITLTASAPSTSGFMSGRVVIGQVVIGDKKVELSVTNLPSFSDSTVDDDDDPIKIRVVERKPSALDSGPESLKFKLPAEFKWIGEPKVIPLWGNDVKIASSVSGLGTPESKDTIGLIYKGINDDELIFEVKVADYVNGQWQWVTKRADGTDGTTKETAFELVLNIEVDNEKDAKPGDVQVSTSGSRSDVSPRELTVATYGQYEATVEAGGAPTIYAGQIDAQIGEVIIKESIAGSLTKGRTILLTLPEWAKWRKIDTDSDNGCTLEFRGFPGTDGRTAKWEVTSESTKDPATLKLEKMEVALRPGVTGNLAIEVGGTAGVRGTITVAKVAIPATMEITGSPVQLNLGSTVNVPDILIKETYAGSIDDDKDLILDLPEGVRFVGTPTVKVEEGDIALLTGNIRTAAASATDDNQVIIPVDSKSSKASTIRVTNIKIAADRSVAEGDVVLKLQGSAVAASIDRKEIADKYSKNATGTYFQVDGKDAFSVATYGDTLFPGYSTTARVTIAKAVAPGETKVTAKFVIGSTTYSVNGVESTMDVAAYTKGGRTYLPVRYVAYALGITPENVVWDGSKATFIASGRVVQVTPGSNMLSINGAPVTMDVVTEVVNGRVMVPFRWVAQAFGAQVDWDEATQTVTMTR